MFHPLLPTYNRTDIAFVRGEGSYLFAEDGKRYLDFGAGIAVNAFTGAALATLLFVGDRSAREQIVFWQLGTINGSRWNEVIVVASITVVGLALALMMSRQYDLLSLGERTAGHLGVKVERLRIVSIVAS